MGTSHLKMSSTFDTAVLLKPPCFMITRDFMEIKQLFSPIVAEKIL